MFTLAVVFTYFATKGIYHKPAPQPTIEYVQGPERTVYLAGEQDTVYRYISSSGKFREKVSEFKKHVILETDTLHLSVKTYPAVDSIDLSYVLNIKIRDTHRTDTLHLARIDTVRMVKIVEVDRPKRFYEQPLLLITAGALVGTLTTIYIQK